MKFTSAIVFCVLAITAFGNDVRASYAGKYAGQQVQQAKAPAHDDRCWMETKKCCWVEKRDGYECRDNYDTRMARCFRKYKFSKKCDKAEKHGRVEKPEGRVDYGKCEKVSYDPNYGTHVAGYPSGMSETYHSKELPKTPYKVDAKPHAPYVAPIENVAPVENAAKNGYRAQAANNAYSAQAASNGRRAQAANNGRRAQAANNGRRAQAANNGRRAQAPARGY